MDILDRNVCLCRLKIAVLDEMSGLDRGTSAKTERKLPREVMMKDFDMKLADAINMIPRGA